MELGISVKVLGICGAGGAGREIAEIAECINEKQQRWSEIVFLEIEKGKSINGYRVLNETEALFSLKKNLEIVVSNGEPTLRKKIFRNILKNNIPLATLIHPGVKIPKTAIVGRGVVINQRAFISCNTSIGDNCYISSSAVLSHDSILEEGCVICGNVTINGNCHIGKYTFIGSNSGIKENIKIGNYVVVGMCTAVIKDMPDNVVIVGNPARILRSNEGQKIFGE